MAEGVDERAGLLPPEERLAMVEEVDREKLLQRAERLAALRKARAALRGTSGLDAYIRRVSPHHPPPRHFAPVIRELERARIPGEKVRVCISMPPRHGKTTLIQHAIPWWLTDYPAETCAYVSYSAQQAWSKSRGTRDLARRAGIQLSPDSSNLAEWRTPAGGGLLSGGIGSGLTGQGVSGLMIVDDPFSTQEDAQSQLNRDKVGEWFDAVVRTRLEGAAVFVIHTRWNEDDLIGRLTKSGEFLLINLPALAESDDPLGRAEGELLWPERADLTTNIYDSQAANAFTFAAMYQGHPRPRGGTVFGPPTYYDAKKLDLTGCRIVLAADPAATESTSADYSAAVVLAVRGRGRDMVAYVLHVYRAQVQIPKFANVLYSLQHTYGNTAINVEAVGGFKAIPQMLRGIRSDLRVNEITPVGDKFTRAQPAATAWNGLVPRILVPDNSPPWLGPFLKEISLFTGVKDVHDDQVDALAHAWNNADPPKSMFDVDWTDQF